MVKERRERMNILLSATSKKGFQYEIRELTMDDLQSDSGFFKTLSGLTSAPVIPLEKACEIFQQFILAGKKVYVARSPEHGIVSTTTLMVEPKFIHGGQPVGHIEDVVTLPEWEGHGIATSLMNEAIKEAIGQGCYKIILDCSDENVSFYQKLCFQRCEIQMRRDLNKS